MPTDKIVMPRWFWGLLVGATAWMCHQSVEVHGIHVTHTVIVREHERRILKLEDRVDKLTDEFFQLKGSSL